MNTDERNGPIIVCLNVSEIKDNNYTLMGLAEQVMSVHQVSTYFIRNFSGEWQNRNPESAEDIFWRRGNESWKLHGNFKFTAWIDFSLWLHEHEVLWTYSQGYRKVNSKENFWDNIKNY